MSLHHNFLKTHAWLMHFCRIVRLAVVWGFLVFASTAMYAQTAKLVDDASDTSLSSASDFITTSPTGINQAAPLARPTDTISTLPRELGKTGTGSQAANPNVRTLTRGLGSTPTDAESQFHRFVSEATGMNLSIFGSALFNTPDAHLPDEGLPVPASYLLGPGDEIQLQVWGSVDFNATLVLDRNGQVNIPKVGTVSLTGISMRDLDVRLRKELSKVFTNFSLNANLARLRSIQIYVMGHARRPGTVVVSSLSTLVSALFISGGPNNAGSMRHIQLQRDGKTVAEFDAYDFIVHGDKSKDLALQSGDVLFIPTVGPRVAVTGSYDHAAIYELKDAQSNIADVLQINGGLPTLASSQKALLERVQPKENPARQVTELKLEGTSLQLTLRDADILTLLPLSKAFSNAVTLRGNVTQPLRFEYKPGMRVSDLITEPEALIQPDYYVRKNAMVQYESGKVVSAERVINEVKNLLEEINWDYAVIERLEGAEVRTQLLPFNLSQAIKAKDPTHNLLLQPGDVVTIFGVNDLPVPTEKRTQFVRVGGEVMVPGIYQIHTGDTLPELIRRAGGLSNKAFVYGTVFTRESTRRQQQVNLDKSIRHMEADINAQAATALQNVVDTEKGSNVQAQIASQRILLFRLQNLKASGRVSLDMDAEHPVLPALPLEGQDEIIVPARPSFVGVFGEVYAENSFIYKPGYTVSDYLDKAGLTREADTDAVTVIRADGTVENGARSASALLGGGVQGKRLNPGDTILVPGRIDRRSVYTSLIQGAKDWTTIFYQFGLGAAGLKTLRN
jgi:protein involved in polysaccharide export with SLBB domain